MSLGLRVRQCPRSGKPNAVKNCLVEEIFLGAETAIDKLFTFHEPHLCYTVVVITLLPLSIPYSHSRGKVPKAPLFLSLHLCTHLFHKCPIGF